MNKLFKLALIALTLFVQTSWANVPVIDTAAIAQLLQQIERFDSMIKKAKRLNDQIQDYREAFESWQNLDHESLAGSKFFPYLTRLTTGIDDIVNTINDYQNGGLLGQINRLDEVYTPYHTDWVGCTAPLNEQPDIALEDSEFCKAQKRLLWTKIQLKHSAKVAAEIRNQLPDTKEELDGLLRDTAENQSQLKSVQILSQLTGLVVKNLEKINVQLAEIVQANSAQGLEQNTMKGQAATRDMKAFEDFGVRKDTPPARGTNPFNLPL
jgi:hypothetical protein